jgi:hypothetical protein
MPRFCFFFGLLTLSGLIAPATAAEPFAIDLEVRSGQARKTAHAQSAAPAAPGARPQPRDVLELKAGDRVTVRWKLSSTDPRATLKDVTVHFFAAREDRVGQRAVPRLDRGVLAETALRMDFGPRDNNQGTLRFTIDRPGCYLFRLETIGATAGPAGHEDFAALDVLAR